MFCKVLYILCLGEEDSVHFERVMFEINCWRLLCTDKLSLLQWIDGLVRWTFSKVTISWFVYLSAFYGYSNHSVVYEETYNTWAIIDTSANPVDFTIDPDNYNVLAILSSDNSESHLPTGLNSWEIFDPQCKGARNLKFTSVIQFWSGTVIQVWFIILISCCLVYWKWIHM